MDCDECLMSKLKIDEISIEFLSYFIPCRQFINLQNRHQANIFLYICYNLLQNIN